MKPAPPGRRVSKKGLTRGCLYAADAIDVIDGQRLTVDHLLPVSALEIDGMVKGKIENDLVTKLMLATSCMDCNWGHREALENWDEFKALLENVVLKNNPNRDDLLRHAQEIHFRVRQHLKQRAS